jgi:hypothetical protein
MNGTSAIVTLFGYAFMIAFSIAALTVLTVTLLAQTLS